MTRARSQVADSSVGSPLPLDPTYSRGARAVRVVTLGCRLNAFESEVMRRHASRAGLDDAVIVNTCAVTAEAVRQAAQTIRKLQARATRRAPDRHRLRRPDRAGALRRHARGRSRHRQCREDATPETFRGLSLADSPRVAVNDIMSVRETAHALIDGFGTPGARLRRGAERLRPSLHLLHHSVRPRAVALGAGGRGGGAGAQAGGRPAMPRSCSPASTSPTTAPACRAT